MRYDTVVEVQKLDRGRLEKDVKAPADAEERPELFPGFWEWLEEHMDASEEEQKQAKAWYDQQKKKHPKHPFAIYKSDDDQRLVFGWASVAVTVDGEPLEDRQHDIIEPEELEAAAYQYVLEFRDAGEEHIETMRKKGRLVESCVFTREKQTAMGLPPGILPEGWWIGFKIDDDEAWARVKDGTYKMFSVEGTAERLPVEKADDRPPQPTGCGVLCVRNGRILCGTRIKGDDRGRLCGPGGHIEAGERPEEAAIREAEEEFGIRCRDLTPLGAQDDGAYGVSAVFLCTSWDGKPRTDEAEMTEPEMLTPSQIKDGHALFPPFAHSLSLLPMDVLRVVAKSFDEVLKYNHSHGPDGRFSSSEGRENGSSLLTTDEGRDSVNFDTPSPTGPNRFKVRGFRNKQKLNNHWKNGRTHQDEYKPDGILTKEQYAARALELIESPVGGNILGHMNKDGEIIRYDVSKNDFAKGKPSKGIKTMFKPKEGKAYYDNLRKTDLEKGGKA